MLPLILVVALALVQTGLLVRDRLLVEAAARAGARAAAIQDDPSAIRSAALAAAPSLEDGAFELDDLPDRRQGRAGDRFTRLRRAGSGSVRGVALRRSGPHEHVDDRTQEFG